MPELHPPRPSALQLRCCRLAVLPWEVIEFVCRCAGCRWLGWCGGWGDLPSTTGPEQGFRCDSAPYTRYKLGCIFDRTLGYLTYSVGDADVNESAQHIFDAQVQPQITDPKFPGKHVPGRLDGPYLHRIYYDTARQNRNTTAAKSTCLSVHGPYDGTVLNCDEYPFKTTLEGAAFGDNNYSARVLDAKDNQRAGSRLGVWFGDDHILDGDAFAINITA